MKKSTTLHALFGHLIKGSILPALVLALVSSAGCVTFPEINPDELARFADTVLDIIEEHRQQEPIIDPNPVPVDPIIDPVIDPAPVDPVPQEDFPWRQVVTVQGGTEPMGNWSEQLGIADVRISRGVITWRFTRGAELMNGWSKAMDIKNHPVGTVSVVVERNGKLVQLATEWELAGQTANAIPETLLAVRGNGKRVYGDEYQVRNGERAWLIVSGLNFIGKRNVRIRSNPCAFEVSNMPK